MSFSSRHAQAMSPSSQVFTNVHTLAQRSVWCCTVEFSLDQRLHSQVNTVALMALSGALLSWFRRLTIALKQMSFQLSKKSWCVSLKFKC